MSDEKRSKTAEEVLADAERTKNEYLGGAIAREERQIELLEQIATQLDSIERLLRDKLGDKQ